MKISLEKCTDKAVEINTVDETRPDLRELVLRENFLFIHADLFL